MLTKNLLVLKNALLGLAIGWTLLIAVLCLISFGDLPSIPVKSADKYVHVTLHFVFTLLWGIYISLKQNQIQPSKIVRIVAVSIGYGILIEILQETLTVTRHADVFDIMANFTGALAALFLLLLIRKQRSLHH
jgi:VanZ family protein